MEFNPWNVLSLEAFHFYNCPECEDKYSTKEQFTLHAIDVHPKARHMIPTILDKSVVISDVQTKLNEEGKPQDSSFDFDCQIKIEAVESDTDLDEDKPKNVTETYKCDKCPKSYLHKKNLKVHIRKVHSKTPSYKCEKCRKTFSGERGLDIHIRGGCHTKVKEHVTYKCDKCDKEYSHKHTLRHHIKSVHEGVTYQCDQCHKDFTQKNHLKEHIRDFHSGLKYKCDHCDKELFSHKGMALHKASHHPDDNSSVYNCNLCSFTSLNQTSYRKHVKRFHNG